MEGHNAREIVPDWFDESIDFMCMDVSFISCKTILKTCFACIIHISYCDFGKASI